MIPGLGAIPGATALGGAARTADAARTAPAGESLGAAFGDLLSGTVSQMKGAEQVSLKALQGNADTRTVVDAVMNAQQSLQTAIAIRDKIVSAYLDISRMAI